VPSTVTVSWRAYRTDDLLPSARGSSSRGATRSRSVTATCSSASSARMVSASASTVRLAPSIVSVTVLPEWR
jgi:hypothetical protein